MKAATLSARIDDALFLDDATSRAKELAETEAPSFAKAAFRQLDTAAQLASSPATRTAAWPLLRDARRLAAIAREAAKLPALPLTAADELLLDDTLTLDGKSRDEARRCIAIGVDAVARMLEGIEPRTLRELTWEKRIRFAIAFIGLSLLVFLAIRFLQAPHNLALNATIPTSNRTGGGPHPFVNGIIEERTFGDVATDGSPSVVVDLGSTHRIRRIVVYGRNDREAIEFLPLTVEVSTDGVNYQRIATQEKQFTSYVPWTIESSYKNIRFVRLSTRRYGRLALAEIEVFGW